MRRFYEKITSRPKLILIGFGHIVSPMPCMQAVYRSQL